MSAKTTALATLDAQALLSQAIEKGLDVASIERLVALGKDMLAVQAKQAYDEAMATFHRDCPTIYKTADGQVGTAKTKYAPLDEIMDKVRPVLGANGLSVSWRAPRSEAGKVVRVCRVSHALGHFEESGEIVIPVGSQGAANPAQQVGLAIAYADRYAVKDILGLAPEPGEDKDGDERNGRGLADRPAAAPNPNAPVVLISEQQGKRLWATLRKSGWGETEQELETAMHDILAGFQITHVRDVPESQLEAIVNAIKAGPKK